MIAAYTRVSTTDQRHDSQLAELNRWFASNGIDPATVRWFSDSETGTTVNRAGLKELEKAIQSGKVKTLVVWKLDRLSRRMLDGMNMLARWCERGVRVVSVTQQIDLSGTMGQMLATVLMGFAQIETEMRRERQLAGIAAAKDQQRKGLRVVYTGRRPGTTKGKPDRAVELRAKGLSPSEIATALGTSERTVWRYLQASEANAGREVVK